MERSPLQGLVVPCAAHYNFHVKSLESLYFNDLY